RQRLAGRIRAAVFAHHLPSQRRLQDHRTERERRGSAESRQEEFLNIMRSETVTDPWRTMDLFAPTEEHRMLAATMREFVRNEVEPQAATFNREEKFNYPLFRRAGDLGLLGLTVPAPDGGTGLDATASVIVCEALSTS